nr:immunoglobulin light chain junction region [Macaca mulatta]
EYYCWLHYSGAQLF